MIENEIAEWLNESFLEGSFTKEQAEYIVFSDRLPLHECWKAHDFAKELFDEFIELYTYEKVEIMETACKNFLRDLEKSEKIAKEAKAKKENDQYFNLIE